MLLIPGINNNLNLYKSFDYKFNLEINFNDFTEEEILINFKNIIGEENYNLLTNTKTIKNGEIIDGFFCNGQTIKIEKNTDNFNLLFYKIFIDGVEYIDFSTKKEFELMFNSASNKNIKIKLYNINKEYIKEYNILLHILDIETNIETINLLSNDKIQISDDISITLSTTDIPYVFVVSEIEAKNSIDYVYIIKAIINNKECIINVGSEISFFSEKKLEVIKDIIFVIKKVFSKKNNNNSIGVVKINTIKDNTSILDDKTYNLSIHTIQGKSFKVINFNNSLFTTLFKEKPLYFYFIINNKVFNDFSIIDDKNNSIPYKIITKDDNLSFIFFSAEDNKKYYYINNKYVINVNFKTLLEPYYYKLNVSDGVIEFETPTFIENLLIDKKDENIEILFENGSYKNIINIYELENGYTDFYLNNKTEKHIAIKNKVKKIIFSNKNISSVYNCFSNFLLNNNDITIYKDYDDNVYISKIANKDEQTIYSLAPYYKTDTKFALENNMLVEYDDGYIIINKIKDTDFIYEDLLFNKNKTNDIGYIFGFQARKLSNKEDELFKTYCDKFKTSGFFSTRKD